MPESRLYPFSTQKHAHEIEFALNRAHNIRHDMEVGEMPKNQCIGGDHYGRKRNRARQHEVERQGNVFRQVVGEVSERESLHMITGKRKRGWFPVWIVRKGDWY